VDIVAALTRRKIAPDWSPTIWISRDHRFSGTGKSPIDKRPRASSDQTLAVSRG
jgi:hypothetical protein